MIEKKADVAKLVDALALGASGATLESSSLSVRTFKKQAEACFFDAESELRVPPKLARILI